MLMYLETLNLDSARGARITVDSFILISRYEFYKTVVEELFLPDQHLHPEAAQLETAKALPTLL